MLSLLDKDRLTQQAQQKHAQRAQQLVDLTHPSASQGGKSKRAPLKKGGKGASGTKTSTSTVAPGQPEVAPYLDAQGLSDLGNRIETSEGAKAAVTNDFQNQAAEAYRAAQQAGQDRTQGAARTNESAYARGLGHSSIRDAALDKIDATYGQTVNNLKGQLALKAVQGQGQLATIRRGDEAFTGALAARMAELAASVPRGDTPFQQNAQQKAKNIPGTVTKRRAK